MMRPLQQILSTANNNFVIPFNQREHIVKKGLGGQLFFICMLLAHFLTMSSFCCRKKEKFTDTALSIANTKLWESRLDATEKSRLEFRDNAKRLAFDNESLQKQLMVTEKDTVDVISYLKREDQSKEDLVSWISRSSVQ